MTKDTMGISDASPYKKFMRNWMLKKYGWNTESEFEKTLRSRSMILDAGTGLGREVINLAKVARQSIVVGIEFSDCAESALKNVSSLSNAYIIQGDLLKPPFREGSFDFILSEGVLHHTPDTEEAFGKCCTLLKVGGEFAFYIYRRRGPIREFTNDYLRNIMREASSKESWEIAERITRLGKALSDVKAKVRVPEDIPELGIKAGETSIHRFIYWNFLKCFWNDELPLDENIIINFDWFVPEHAHRHSADEIREWCRKNNVEIIWFNEEESGYSVRGLKRK
jgi:SAM-dependent methyltransferase